jgi:hypothetical protein
MVAWELGEKTFACPELILNNPATCAECATQNGFLNTIGWNIVTHNGTTAWQEAEATEIG